MVTASNRIMARIITNPDVKMKGILVLLSKSVLAAEELDLLNYLNYYYLQDI
jgi:hypothetical protein